MLVPSEKHLEDWIVAHPYNVTEHDHFGIRRIIETQPRFPSGIPDIIVALKLSIGVIELKKGCADGEAVAQIMRYIGDIRHHLAYLARSMAYSDNGEFRDYLACQLVAGVPMVRGLLIAKSFDYKALIAANALEIETLQYDYDGTDYVFSYPDIDIENVGWLENTETFMGIKEVIRHAILFYEDKACLKAIYEQERQS